jgi:acyl-CoA dehydrogenase
VASKSPEIAQYLRSLTRQQRLIASVTSEVGTDGDLRRSIAGIVTDDDGRFSVSKMATTISYGQYADDLLLTVRSSSSAAEQDQRLILALGGSFRLEATTAWDTLGMRGTCSPGARVEVTGDPWQILPESFGSIASRTMVPYSHLLWSSCWTGIANDAARRARSVLRQKARKEPASAPLGGAGLVGLDCKLQLMRSDLSASLADYEAHRAATGSQMDIALSIRLNNLKLNASRLVREIVTDAMEVCGVSAYRNDSEASLARHLRDAMSATLMISNERILDANAAMLLVHKGGRGTHFLDLQ